MRKSNLRQKKPMRKSLISFLFAAPLFAQSFIPFQAGSLNCGLVERASNQVQVYCRDANSTLVYNTIQTVGKTTQDPGLTIKFINSGTDGFWAIFNVVNNIIQYEIISNVSLVGQLTFIYGATGACQLIDMQTPNFVWTANSKSCTTVWSNSTWLDCCLGN